MGVEKQSQNLNRESLMSLARTHPEALVDIILEQREEIFAFKALVHKLAQQVQALEARLAQNSGNSNKPPSSDGYIKPSPRSMRKKSGRKSGGQKGHPGSTLTPVTKPDHIVRHLLKLCPCGCGADLRKQALIRHDIRQVFELPPQKLEVTQHEVEVKRCPNTGAEVFVSFPPDVKVPAQYGHRFKAWLAYLHTQQLIPLKRISQMARDLYGYRVGAGTIQAAVSMADLNLEGFEACLKALVSQSPIVHADESGLRVAKKLHWLHVASTKKLTWYGVHAKRGGEAIRFFGILPRLTGRLIHDCFGPYFKLDCSHGLCNVHLQRELTFLHEILNQKWAKSMVELMRRMHRSILLGTERAGPFASTQVKAWTKKYRLCLRQGFAQNRVPLALKRHKQRGRPKHTKAQNLLFRLQKHEHSVLAFLHDSQIPFTNNQGEQDIRMIKVQQKISGCFRTLRGAQAFARIRSYLSTVRKNDRDVFREMVNLLAGHPFIPTEGS